MRPIRYLVAFLLAAALLTACGDDEGSSSEEGSRDDPAREVAGDADPEAVEVISAWSEALERGDVDAAAEKFAIPSVAENGPILVRIRTREQARAFNRSLPCGGRLIEAQGEGEITTATFRLTERPGPGRCGNGVGSTAQASIVVRDGKITEWRRVGAAPPAAPGRIT